MTPRADEPLPLLKGTLDLLILKTLSWGPLHGFAIASWLESRSDGGVGVDDSALYQALHRLELRGQLEGEWGISDQNRRVRFYRLTRAGRQRLTADTATWERYARTVGAILALSARNA